MSDYSFRIRLLLPKRVSLETDESSIHLTNLRQGREATLRSINDEPIRAAKELEIRSSGWESEKDAEFEGGVVRACMMRTMARLKKSADFGFRKPVSGLAPYTIKRFEERSGERVLNDKLGLMVFSTEPTPLFIMIPPVNLTIPSTIERFLKMLSISLENVQLLSRREETSYGLYSSSFFAQNEDSRFLNLMMAVEALLEPKPRPKAARDFVDQFITQTYENEHLSDSDKQSMIGSLKWLESESISRTGRNLARSRLGSREYMDMKPENFFNLCYSLRSRLVHADDPLPSRDEIAKTVASLEVFVSDLLSGALLDVEI